MEGGGCIPDVVTYEIIIGALSEKDVNTLAEKLYHEMIARSLL